MEYMASGICNYPRSKVLVTSLGLVGTAIKSVGRVYPQYEFLFANREDSDLRNPKHVANLFIDYKPDYVIHTAGRVGGIQRNIDTPAEQFYDNIMINSNVIHYAALNKVKRIIAFTSVCAFPDGLQELSEEKLHDGVPHKAHESYAYAKRMVDVQLRAYKKQYGLNGCCLIPGNMFGEADNYNLKDGHVVPTLIRKFYEAKVTDTPVVVWGNGSSYREFLYAKDVAEISIRLLHSFKLPELMIVSGNKEITIKSLVKKIAKIYKYDNIKYDTSKPNGQLRRPTNKTNFNKYFSGFKFTDIDLALENSIGWFKDHYREPLLRL